MIRVLITCLTVALPCFAQAGRATLSGTISDPSGLPVVNAKIEVEHQATMARFTQHSDGRGEYRIFGLPAGRYVLTVEQPGFRTYRQSGITLRVEDTAALNVTLTIGVPTQSVEVSAATPLLQTGTGDVSYHVDETKIATLPLDGRNFIPLVALS